MEKIFLLLVIIMPLNCLFAQGFVGTTNQVNEFEASDIIKVSEILSDTTDLDSVFTAQFCDKYNLGEFAVNDDVIIFLGLEDFNFYQLTLDEGFIILEHQFIEDSIKVKVISHYRHGFEYPLDIFILTGDVEIHQTFHGNGRVAIEAMYLDENLHGPYISYYQNGAIRQHIMFRFGKKHGVEEFYDENGQIESADCYLNGNSIPCPYVYIK